MIVKQLGQIPLPHLLAIHRVQGDVREEARGDTEPEVHQYGLGKVWVGSIMVRLESASRVEAKPS